MANRELCAPAARFARPACESGWRDARYPGHVLLVGDIASVDRNFPATARRLKGDAQLYQGIRSLTLDGVVGRREKGTALPPCVGARRRGPEPVDADLIDDRRAAGPLRRIAQAVSRSVECRSSRKPCTIAIIGSLQPRHVARKLQTTPGGRRLDFDTFDCRRAGV